MSKKASVTVLGSPEEVRRRWQEEDLRPEYIESHDTAVSFKPAPGDRGTEIHVDLEKTAPGGKAGEMLMKLTGKEPLAKVKDDLRRFKAQFETGVIPRSEGSPEGELAERKLKQRPAQPLKQDELQKVGV
ncbi:MAG TPA: hypothetical protein VFX35_04565 [Solirubrobacterales bacterium]|nr:hypothetical protein [Solirubrobacterales bacterium]